VSVWSSRSHLRRAVILTTAIVLAAALAGIVLDRTQLRHTSVSRSAALALALHHDATRAIDHSTAPTPIHDALFIGASYTQGLGAIPPDRGYAYLIGQEPGWRAQVDGVSGTGYLNPGPRGDQTFADRLANLPTHPHPDLVIFQGGRNDTAYPMPRLRAAILNTVALARERFKGAQIVLLGPIPADIPVPHNQIAVENTLRAAATACKVVFIDPIAEGWITPGNENGYAGHVSGHPDNEGYAYIAKRLTTDLDTMLAQRNQD
jgi:hypothetical protein